MSDISTVILAAEDILDDFDRYKEQFLPREDGSLADILRDELTGFCCYIADADDDLGIEERLFIEQLHRAELTDSQIRERAEQFEKKTAGSFDFHGLKVLLALDKLIWGANADEDSINPHKHFVSRLAEVFEVIGSFIIDLDKDINGKESERCITFLDDFKDFLYGRKSNKQSVHEESAAAETAESEKPEKPEDSNLHIYLEELNSLVGLENIKAEISSLISLIKIRKLREEKGFKSPDISLHMVFTGNPGTGKTTVARLLARIYKAIGILSSGQLIEVDRGGLVAEYVGHTAKKTSDAIDAARGGILFIDEAYALIKEGRDFGSEAVETLLKAMEDRRNQFIVIAAGYPDLMRNFISSNPGLKSRFTRYMHFDDYDAESLTEIISGMCAKFSYEISDSTRQYIRAKFEDICRLKDENFANGRLARNIFENAVISQADRLVKSEKIEDQSLNILEKTDFDFSKTY